MPAHQTTTPSSLDEYVDRLVAAAPPLSPAQLDRLTVLLAPASGGCGR